MTAWSAVTESSTNWSPAGRFLSTTTIDGGDTTADGGSTAVDGMPYTTTWTPVT